MISNSSAEFYSDNTVTDFRTKLHHDIRLDTAIDFEVALVEVSFTRNWFTISKADSTIMINCKACSISKANPDKKYTSQWEELLQRKEALGEKHDAMWGMLDGEYIRPEHGEDVGEPGKVPVIADASDDTRHRHVGSHVTDRDKVIVTKLPGGYYDQMNDLINDYNTALAKDFQEGKVAIFQDSVSVAPKFKYNASTKRVTFAMPNGYVAAIGSKLQSILGFAPEQLPLINKEADQRPIKGMYVSDLQAGVTDLYVYCNLIESVSVGDTIAPLLRIVDASGANGDVIYRQYDQPRYLPLRLHQFESVHLYIRDRFGEQIEFEGGTLTAVLHIRRAQNNYFL